MSGRRIILSSFALSLLLTPFASPVRAQVPGLGGVIQAQQQLIEQQKKADEEKAKADAEAAKKEAEANSPDTAKIEGGGTEAKAEDKKPDDAKPDEKKADANAKTDDKKADDKKTDDKKADGKKDDKTAEADKKEDAEKKAEADKKAEEEKKEADKKLFSTNEKYDPMKHALFAIQNGKAHEGIELLTQTLQKNPLNWQAHYLLGYAYVMQRKYAQAADEYRKIMSGAPNSPIGKLAAEGLAKIRQ